MVTPYGFTLYPLNTIAADTNTAEFDGSRFAGFYLVVVTAAVGALQTLTPVLQMVLPDGTTWIDLEPAAAAITTATTTVYAFGKAADVASNTAAGITEAHPSTLTARMRFKWDVFNAANITVTGHIIPFNA